MNDFADFIEICRRWPLNSTLRYETIRLEFEACLEQGFSAETILAGTKNYLARHVSAEGHYALAPHNFLREKSFMVYLPAEHKLQLVSST